MSKSPAEILAEHLDTFPVLPDLSGPADAAQGKPVTLARAEWLLGLVRRAYEAGLEDGQARPVVPKPSSLGRVAYEAFRGEALGMSADWSRLSAQAQETWERAALLSPSSMSQEASGASYEDFCRCREAWERAALAVSRAKRLRGE